MDEDALLPGDMTSFAHWNLRKLLNHDPMAKMEKLLSRHQATAQHVAADSRGTILPQADGSFLIRYQEPGGREFEISMREVPEAQKVLKRDDYLAKMRQEGKGTAKKGRVTA